LACNLPFSMHHSLLVFSIDNLNLGYLDGWYCRLIYFNVKNSYFLLLLCHLNGHPILQAKEDGNGRSGSFTLDEDLVGFLFVLKLNDSTWLNCMGNDFYIALPISSSIPAVSGAGQSEVAPVSENTVGADQEVSHAIYTDGIINEIRSLVSDFSSEKRQKTKTKEAQESILQEIEKLAAEAYSIFRSSIPTFLDETALESEATEAPKICSGTGTGHEILLQGFNWESHKLGHWYMELKQKIEEISSLGFTVVWLPPPTESVSPEGYMPKDLYNLNSRYIL